MADYKELYLKMAAEIADAIETLTAARERLIRAQQECERIIIDFDEKPALEIIAYEKDE